MSHKPDGVTAVPVHYVRAVCVQVPLYSSQNHAHTRQAPPLTQLCLSPCVQVASEGKRIGHAKNKYPARRTVRSLPKGQEEHCLHDGQGQAACVLPSSVEQSSCTHARCCGSFPFERELLPSGQLIIPHCSRIGKHTLLPKPQG